MTKRRVVATAVLCTTLLASTTEAFLGIGDIVFDPSVFAQAVEQVVRLERQYAQLVQSYQMLRQQYEQMRWNALRVPVDMSNRYRALATPWATPKAGNVSGTTGAWNTASATGVGVENAFRDATQTLRPYDSALALVPADQRRYVQTSYGTVELTEGVTQGALQTIGRLRANALGVQDAVARLEADTLSSDPEMNTAVAVLNKMSAAGVIALRSAQDTNALLIALAEQEAVEAKRMHDAEARAINHHIRFVAQARPVLAAQSAGTTDAMRTWRMP